MAVARSLLSPIQGGLRHSEKGRTAGVDSETGSRSPRSRESHTRPPDFRPARPHGHQSQVQEKFMKLKTLFTGTFTPDQPLRTARAGLHAKRAKIDRSNVDAASRRKERAQRIAERAAQEDASEIETDGAFAARCGELELLAGVSATTAAQVTLTLPDQLWGIDGRYYQLALVLNDVSARAHVELKNYFRGLLASAFEGVEDYIFDRVLAALVHDCPADNAFYFSDPRVSISPSADRFDGVTEDHGFELAVDRVLSEYERLAAALKKHASFLPKGFSPFPASLDEMESRFPLRQREIPAPAPAPEREPAEATIE